MTGGMGRRSLPNFAGSLAPAPAKIRSLNSRKNSESSEESSSRSWAARKSCASADRAAFGGPYFQGLQLGIPIVGFSYGDRCYWLPRVVNRRQRRSAELLTFSRLECPLTTRSRIPAGAEIHVRFNQRLAGPVFPIDFPTPSF
jgi:hypothetical protein